MSNAPIVRNAADTKQVEHGRRKERDRRASELGELAELLKLPEFRRFAWRLMAFCGFMTNPSRPRGDETHQNIGKADVARWLLDEFGEAGAIEQWLLMQREAHQARRNEQLEAEAVRTPSAQHNASQHTSDEA